MNEPYQTYYQIQSFRFDNNFDNIFIGDALQMHIVLAFQDHTPTGYFGAPFPYPPEEPLAQTHFFFAVPGLDDVTAIPFDLSPGEDLNGTSAADTIHQYNIQGSRQHRNSSCAGDELILKINQYLAIKAADIAVKMTIPADASLLTTGDKNLLYFSQCCQFTYDTTSGKYGISRNALWPVFTCIKYNQSAVLEWDGAAPDSHDLFEETEQYRFRLDMIHVTLSTNPKAETKIQTRLGKYFAMDVNTAYTTGQTIEAMYEQNFIFANEFNTAQYVSEVLNVAQSSRAEVDAAFKDTITDPATGIYYHVYDPWSNNSLLSTYSQTQTLLSRYPMNETAFEWIYIRGTLNTNFWEYDGTKSDVLEIVPVQKSITDVGTEIRNMTRVYQAKDNGFNTFQIRFTDENNQLIPFKSDYMLNIAIFFGNC